MITRPANIPLASTPQHVRQVQWRTDLRRHLPAISAMLVRVRLSCGRVRMNIRADVQVGLRKQPSQERLNCQLAPTQWGWPQLGRQMSLGRQRSGCGFTDHRLGVGRAVEACNARDWLHGCSSIGVGCSARVAPLQQNASWVSRGSVPLRFWLCTLPRRACLSIEASAMRLAA